MPKPQPFQPNWASPPWGTIADILREREIPLDTFQQRMGFDLNTLGMLVGGSLVIDQPIAERLRVVLGSSAQFWINRDTQYRESLARITAPGYVYKRN